MRVSACVTVCLSASLPVALFVCGPVIEVSHDAMKLSQTEADYVTLCADNDILVPPYNFKVSISAQRT